ncbi:hypothetical protein I5M27_03040 [Adhaeribacter sp. BT258]|uniref:Uncharacterized protein n=1 Tax=Adhaeribacter terrigena TaxID=2793070 RepID=A0ABS1BXS4_9BACT|nr:DUF6756 family protein [Adhaeribacter terrigena]MBK0401944.1 hypothetical protein [Adhaeribacter terrigena]
MATFRERIIGLARLLKLSREQFTVGPFTHWPAIQKKIESRFIMKTSSDLQPQEWPEHFKGRQKLIPLKGFEPYEYLDELLPENEIYWLLLPDPNVQESKLWLFQGTVQAIQKVLSQLPKLAFYVVAKKYEWLLFYNQQDAFIGLGELPEKPEPFREPEPSPQPPETPEGENS